ncbi:neurochondrin-like [Clytia hemisphaerica]|uniref:Neurochondrin n=1 Tax=Clytia hemisphaerica TaxID=252671 RepID=A0A7M5UKM6_9CNID
METFENCLQSLKQSKSDNERLAALMVISKLTQPTSTGYSPKPLEINEQLAGRLYNAVSGTFIVRLLKTSESKDENALLFHQLALNVLTVVARYHSHSISKDDCVVEQLVSLLHETTKVEEQQSILDLLTVLLKDSHKLLLDKNPTKLLSTSLKLFKEKVTEKSAEMFLTTIMSSDSWSHHLATIMYERCEVLLNNQDLQKFKELEILEKLTTLLRRHNAKMKLNEEKKTKMLENVALAAQDLLKSRVKSEYKCLTISLVSNMIHFFGLDWIFTVNEDSSKFCLLLLACISVELAWILNSDSTLTENEVLANERFVVACFEITKMILVRICSEEFEDSELARNSSFIVNLFNTFKNIINTVYSFIQTFDNQDACLDHPLLLGAMDLVCVWATEETESLQEELKTTIPILLKFARETLENKNNGTIHHLFTSLLPCIAQLLPDNDLRKLMIDNGLLDLLQTFGDVIKTDEKENQLVECFIHIFHEVTILIPTHCKRVTWKASLIEKFVKLYHQGYEIRGMFTLYSRVEMTIVLLRLPVLCGLKLPDENFLQSVTGFLSDNVDDLEDMGESYSGMWSIAMQSLLEVVSNNDFERNKLKGSSGVKRALSEASKNAMSKNVKSLIKDLQRILYT